MSVPPDPPQPVLPALDYATPSADGLPDWVPEAEALIDVGAGPMGIRRCFRRSWDASAYFAKSMSRRHTVDQWPARCVGCGRSTVRACLVEWGVRTPPKTLEFQVSSASGYVGFHTHHPVCPDCALDWQVTVDGAEWLKTTAISMRWGAVVSPILLVILAISIPGSEWLLWVCMLCLCLIPLAMILRWSHTRTWRNAMPRSIRELERNGAWIQAVDFCDADELTARRD